MNRDIKLFTVLAVLLLTACQSPQGLLDATATISLSPIPVKMETATSTITPSPTATIYVTATSTFTPIPPTPYIPPTQSPATVQAVATLETLVFLYPELKELEGLGISPNGKWVVFFSPGDGGGGLKLVRIDGKKQWDVDFGTLKGLECPCGDGHVQIEHWSSDGRYVYLAPRQESSGGGHEFFWRAFIKLIRLNLDNGSWVDTKFGPGHVFSPQDDYVAYQSSDGVRVRWFLTGREMVFPVPGLPEAFGRFVWSPDSSQLVFISSPTEEPSTGFSIFLIDLKTERLQTILLDDPRLLYPVSWDEPGKILFEGYYSGEQYWYEMDSGEFYLIELE